jgi:hypothetical protein
MNGMGDWSGEGLAGGEADPLTDAGIQVPVGTVGPGCARSDDRSKGFDEWLLSLFRDGYYRRPGTPAAIHGSPDLPSIDVETDLL